MTDASHPFTALLRDAAVVDVRSPAEFAKGAAFGAINIPLFSNDERAEIGILYRQLGREPAIRRGLHTVGGRLSPFVSAFERFRGQPLVVYCARGGMRSQSVVALLAGLGYSVRQLEGGYKAYRNYLLAELERTVPQHLIVIHGETGVGKTQLLNRLPNALDLEGAAQHRSSLFGGVNREPRTQQQFEADLLHRLQGLHCRQGLDRREGLDRGQGLDGGRPVWIEGESRKVGAVTIPDGLRRAMAGATCVLVTASLETRVTRIIAEYAGTDPSRGSGQGSSDTAGLNAATLSQLEAALGALRSFFGAARTEGLLAQLRAGKLRPLVRTLLEEHYDPRYRHAMRHYTYALTVSSEDLDAAAKQLAAFGEGAELNSRKAEPQMTEGLNATAEPQIAQMSRR